MTAKNSIPSTPLEDKNGRDGPDRSEIRADTFRTATAMSARETVCRYGSANAEYIKGYRGVDNETGQTFAKGLAGIAKHKVNADPFEAEKNIKQQAGFSAEVATTSRDNAEAIIEGKQVRTSRSDDIAQYGKNHNVVDRVQVLDGQIIEGSQSQMKFVGDRNQLFERIASEDGKFARYRGVKLELPSEQYESDKVFCQRRANELRDQAKEAETHGKREVAARLRREASRYDQHSESAKAFCQRRAKELREQAQEVEGRGKSDVAAKLRREASNYDELAENVSDSGLTTEQAVFYRKHPELATLRDIALTSHRAGVEGAKYGALIGGCISLVKNSFAVAQGGMEWRDAATEVGLDVVKSGGLGYGTAAVGAAIKAGMQQSGQQSIRALANTSAPALVVNVCLSLSISVRRYVSGELSETDLLIEVGEKGAGMLSSGMMAALGQIALPIPFVGAAIGGMAGYALSSIFYQSALDAAKGAAASRANLERVRAVAAAARVQLSEEQATLDAFMARELPQLHRETQQLFAALDAVGNGCIDDLSAAVNQYAALLGKQLQFQSMAEFDDFMLSDQPLRL